MHRVFCDPTPHAKVAEAHVVENGLAILSGVLSNAELDRVREAVWRTAAAIDPDGNGVHQFDLTPNEAIFRGLLEHPTALHFATCLLGPKLRLSNFSAIITAPGSEATGVRADQGYVTAPWPEWPLALTIIWAVDAFTVENGAPRVMPDSVRYGHGPEWDLDYPEATPLVCPAGSIVLMDGRIWHQTGPNTTTGARRIAVCASYIRPWILPEVDWSKRVPLAMRGAFSPRLRVMLGFGDRATRHPRTRHGRQIWLDDPTPEV